MALELCDAQGFDATTVEQIADAADVSPRTINRYFASKEDIVIAPIAEWGAALADHLRAQPVTGNELQALMDAFLAVIDSVIERDDPLPFRWFQQMQRIIRDSAAVRAFSLDAVEHKTEQVTVVVAERLGATVDALPVRLIVSTWHTIMRVGTECEPNPPECVTASARGLADAVVTAYHEYIRICAAPTVSGPTSETAASDR